MYILGFAAFLTAQGVNVVYYNRSAPIASDRLLAHEEFKHCCLDAPDKNPWKFLGCTDFVIEHAQGGKCGGGMISLIQVPKDAKCSIPGLFDFVQESFKAFNPIKHPAQVRRRWKEHFGNAIPEWQKAGVPEMAFETVVKFIWYADGEAAQEHAQRAPTGAQ